MTSGTAGAARRDFPALNGARALAAFAVVATHAGFNSGRSLRDEPFSGLLFRLDFGVTLFFLLSGFLLSRQFFVADVTGTASPALRRFWWRRALRILPAYWLTIVIVLGVLSTRPATTGDWVSYLLLVQTYDHHALDPSLSQMWTLGVEVAFYAVLPLLIGLSRLVRAGRQTQVQLLLVGMLLTSLGGNVLAHALDGGTAPALLWLPLYLDWFALGMALASIGVDVAAPARWQRGPLRWAESPLTCLIIGGLLLWLSILPLAGPRTLAPVTTWEWTFKHYLYGASAFFLLLPLVLGGNSWPDRILGNRVMRWFGEISYGVYLWHLGLLIALQRWIGWPTFGGHFVELFLVTAAASTLVAATSWHLVERPLLRRFSTSWRRPPRTGEAQQQGRNDGEAQQLYAGAASERVR